MDSPPVEPKKRIRVACHSCRRKKIRCDGDSPCAHCVFSKDTCVYAERPPTIKKIKSKALPDDASPELPDSVKRLRVSATKQLSKKVDMMERSLNQMNAKIDALVNLTVSDAAPNPPAAVASDSEDPDSDSEALPSPKSGQQPSPAKSNLGVVMPNNGVLVKDSHEKYFGAHSVFCIFSESSLDWMARLLEPLPGGQDVVTAVQNFPRLWFSRNKPLLAMWIDPPLINIAKKLKMLERPFSSDRNYIMGLIDVYYRNIHVICDLCPASYVISLFEDYYSVSTSKPPRRLTTLELLIMTTLLLLAISSKASFERTTPGAGGISSSGTFLNESDQALLTEFTNNAIFYYQRISIISEGIESIQGILMLMSFIDTNWSGAPFSYTLALLAIRHGQDMGLHRFDSYLAMAPEEVKKRRIVWASCQLFDVETCYRFGKPPLINMADALMSEEYSMMDATPADPQTGALDSDLKALEDEAALEAALYRISCLRYKLYHLLFVASSQNASYRSMAATLDILNDEMFAIAASLDIKDRPLFSKDPNFSLSNDPIDKRRARLLYLHFVFFFHLLVINRLPSLVGPLDLDADCVDATKYRNLSHDSARTILVLAKQINRKNCDIMFFNWMLFFVLTAYLHILASVLNFPDHPETHLDIYLLVDALMNFFSAPENHRCEFLSDERHPSSKNSIVSLLVCAVLQVCIIYYEHKTGNQVASLIPGLMEHLKTPREVVSELFVSRKASLGLSTVAGAPQSVQTTIRASTVYPLNISVARAPAPFHNTMMPFPPIQPTTPRSVPSYGSLISSYPPSFTRPTDGRSPSLNAMMPPLPPMSPRYGDRVHSPYSYGTPAVIPPMMTTSGVMDVSDDFNDDNITSKLFPQMHTTANFFFDNSMVPVEHQEEPHLSV